MRGNRMSVYLVALLLSVGALAIAFGRVPGLPGFIGEEWEYIADGDPAPAPSVIAAAAQPATPPTAPPPGLEEMPFALGKPAELDVSSGIYEFQDYNPDQTPVRFSPCRPIHFVIRPDNMPPGGDKTVIDAVAAVSRATGLVFIYDGFTKETPVKERDAYQPDVYGDRWAPVLIAWATPKEIPSLQTDLVGEATTYQLVRGNGYSHYVTGQIVLDADRITELRQDYGDGIIGAVVRHELGHLVGLAHTTLDSELMYPETRVRIMDFQAGDLTGLAEAGQGTCAPDI